MKIGVYISDVTPESGGASSLLGTIKKEILASKLPDEYIICYRGGWKNKYKTVSDFTYINLDKVLSKLGSRFIFFRIFRRIRRILNPALVLNQSKIRSEWNTLAQKEKIDIFWFASPVKENILCPYIYTVWDLGHRVLPCFPEVSITGWNWEEREETYQQMLAKATFIITGNETGKQEILENYSVPASKIFIAQFPVASFCYGEEKKPSFDLPEKYFIYPAQFWPHKNHIRILEALKILKEQGVFPSVIFTGSDKGNKNYILEKVKEYGLENQILFSGFLSNEELKYLYTHAYAMIFASLMGPNNMPPIEATFLHCPVIITDIPGHKEQLKDTALYFDGYDAKDLAEKIKLFYSNGNLRNDILQKQIPLSEEFAKIDYFAQIRVALEKFRLMRSSWGVDYIHN